MLLIPLELLKSKRDSVRKACEARFIQKPLNLLVLTDVMNSNSIILKVVIVIIFYLIWHYLSSVFSYLKMSVISVRYVFNIYIAVTEIVLLKPDEDWYGRSKYCINGPKFTHVVRSVIASLSILEKNIFQCYSYL